jgi:hypothetical protein
MVNVMTSSAYDGFCWILTHHITAHYIADINPKVGLGTDASNYVNGFTHSPWRMIMQ